MAGVTLHAKERLRHLEKRLVGRPVRLMTVDTVFRDIGMLVNKRPLIFHMTTGTGIPDGIPQQGMLLGRTVRVVTIRANYFLLKRVMGKLGKFQTNFLMTVVTDLFLFVSGNLLLGTLVELVAIKAADPVVGVRA